MWQFVYELLLIVLRYGIVSGLTWLAARHVLTEEQFKYFSDGLTDPKVLAAIAGGITVVATAIWSWVNTRRKLLTALATPAATSEQAVTAMVKDGSAPPLSTPKASVPVSPAPSRPNEPKE